MLNLFHPFLRRALLIALAGLLILNFGIRFFNPGEAHGEASRSQKALILYDAPPDEPKLGKVYSMMLQALLGHFKIPAQLQPVSGYQAGQLEGYSTVFYLGSYYNNPLPDDFLRDAASFRKRMVWFKYNFWQLTSPTELQFEAKSGMSFLDLQGLNAEPTPENPNPGFYDTVLYKGKSLVKYYHYDADTKEVMADPDLGLVKITNPETAQARVMIKNSQTGEMTPYIVQAGPEGNFWYIADLPFSYIGPRDRYLVFCDILHDILGIQHEEIHRALVRLEDVNAKVSLSSMKNLSDFLYSRHIPFTIATIPHYMDPLGVTTRGMPESIPFEQATVLHQALQYAMERGGSVVMHGFTHQYNNQRNPHTGVSADDFEFWNAVSQTPVKEDSEKWAMERLNRGMSEFASKNIKPWAWETPHYQGSPLTYRAMSKRFSTTYQRVVYYTSTSPNLNAQEPNKDYAAGMFFPYIIHRDPYGHYIIPENLGNIEYDIRSIDPSSNITYTWKDILENASDALVVRDGFGSFFFHPFWIDQGFEDLHAFEDFKNLVDGITALGYQWTDAQTLALKPNATLEHQ